MAIFTAYNWKSSRYIATLLFVKQEFPELKENYARVLPNLMEHNKELLCLTID